jgi:2-methylcitrate dehydratase PrpD
MTIHAPPVLRRPDTPGWLGELAAFCAGLRPDAIPAAVTDHAALVLLDTVGVIAAGAQEPEIGRLADRLAALHGAGEAPLIGLGRRAAPAVAALVNGTAGTMLELDEGNQFCRGHPGIHVIPAALAAAQALGRSGRDLLAAIVLGYEVGARIGIAAKLRPSMHPHGTWGVVGAAVAVAWLNRASAAQMAETVNVASTLGLATSRRTMLEGGTVRNAFAGSANLTGLHAWAMVEAGLTGEADGLGTVFGTVIAEDWTPSAMVADLGTRWEIARNYFKRHACCRYNHAALDALERIVAEAGGIDPAAVEGVEIATYVWAAQLAGAEPHNMLAAKFSLPFAIATTLHHGAAGVAAFRDAARLDPAIRALARRVRVTEDPALTAALPARRPAVVTLSLRDGRRFTARAEVNRGDVEAPYGPDALRTKFRELCGPVWGEARSEALRGAIETIAEAPDTAALTAYLAEPRS